MPPEAIVTLPETRLPLVVRPVTVALPLTALLTPVAVNWPGIVSLMLPVSVDGPAFVTTSVKLVVPPTATVVEPTVFLGVMFTTLVTVPDTVAVLEPLLVVPTGTSTLRVLV